MLEFRQVHKAYSTPQGPLKVLARVDPSLSVLDNLRLQAPLAGHLRLSHDRVSGQHACA
ncbi:hypothetical protein KG088_07580 [Halomonas sp. TRM85114]|uniref:hypothetical protein n=1 Tax=Halomonas jincaotanensis TaxID=2810616 RepID=UPI001BD34946|nr:hypothetical protein [Halomonas jincaotanensis]MBS9403486.1 hypothetical protein [Halomonas jincaotanensis]